MRYFILYIVNAVLTILLSISSLLCGIFIKDNNLPCILCRIVALFTFLIMLIFVGESHLKLANKTYRTLPRKKFKSLLKKMNNINNKLEFIYENRGYRLKTGNLDYYFDLKTCILKKSFVIGYIVKTIRKEEVSEKLPLYNLFRRTLKVEKYKNIILSFSKNNKKKEHYIVKNGVSKYSFLAQIQMLWEIPGKRFRMGVSLFETIRLN